MTDVPDGWRCAAIADVCQVVSGGTPKTGVAAFWDGDIAWITPKDLARDRSQVVHAGARSITREGLANSSASLFPAGSVIVSSRAPIGYVAIAGQEMSTNQGCKTAIPPSGIDSRYLYWHLIHSKNDLEARASGTTFKEISGKEFGRTLLRWPELAEQGRIVETLEDHLSRLDAAARTLQRVADRAGTLRAASRTRLFARLESTVGLVPLLDVCSIANGQTPKAIVDRVWPQKLPGSVPYFKIGDMNEGDGRWMESARNYIMPEAAAAVGLAIRPAGTVLIPKRGGAIATNKKRILREAGCFDLNTMGFVPTALLEPSYLWHWLRSVDLAAIADGSNVPQINAPQIRKLALPVPALVEQRAASEELDELDEAVDRLRLQTVVGRERSYRLRRALLNAAFSGRLTA